MMQGRHPNWAAPILSAVILVLFLAAWQLAVHDTSPTAGMDPEYAKLMGAAANTGKSAIPTPWDVAVKLWEAVRHPFYDHGPNDKGVGTQLAFSLARVLLGFALAAIVAIPLGFLIGMSPLILSMLITPIATELPEKMNSVLWIGRGRDVLALGNITGAMVFQSSFPVVLGMIATPWDLRGAPLVSAGIALVAGLWLLLVIRWRGRLSPWTLLACGPLYGLFIAYVVWWR